MMLPPGESVHSYVLTIDTQGVLPKVDYMGRLRPKGVAFCPCSVRKGGKIYCLRMLKARRNTP